MAVVLSILLAGSSLAQDAYRLEAGDQIELWTSVEPSLRRSVTIQPDGWISLPLVGHIQASGHTVPELEKLLQDQIKGYFKEALDLTVMLQSNTERPQIIYVSGDVTTPGSYPYRPGMLVVHCVSMAGGLFRTTPTAADEDRAALLRRDMRLDEARLASLSAQIARIEAEMSGAELAVPDASTSPQEIEREREIFEARRSEDLTEDNNRAEVEMLRTRELDALQQQFTSVSDRIRFAEQRLGQMSKLVARGFANQSELLQLEGDLAGLRATQHELQARIEQATLNMKSDLSQFEARAKARRSALLLEMRDVRRDRDAVQSRMEDNRRILASYQAGSAAPAPQADSIVLSIVRVVNGKATETDVTELSNVQAGDLIRVRREALGSSRSLTDDITMSVQQDPSRFR